MDFTGPAPLGSQAVLMALPAQRRAPDVKAIDPGRQTGGAGTDARERPEQDQTAAAARDITALRAATAERDLPVGPPPSFEVSLLEMDRDLKHLIARIEAARAQVRDADALKLEAVATETEASAEAQGLEQSIASADTARSDSPPPVAPAPSDPTQLDTPYAGTAQARAPSIG